jgi:pyruvate,water dikinase
MKHWVIDREPSRRFPVYTRGNAGEVFPNVMSPMTGSLIGDAASEGQTRSLQGLGMLVDDDVRDETTVGTGVFGGYLYGNLSLMRVACERAPGMSALDADRQMAGLTDDAPPHRPQPGDKSWRATSRGTWSIGRAVLRPDISEVDAAREATDRWRSSIPPAADRSDDELVRFVSAYPPRFADGMCRLLTYSGFAGASASMVEQFAERAGTPPGTATTLASGLGTIDSAAPAIALWNLGRQVAASRTLSDLFDARADPRDHVGEPDVDRFARDFESFLAAHGARGPDEWELASPTWGTDPEIAFAAIERLRHAPDERDPVIARRRLAASREHALMDTRARLARPLRPIFDRLVRAAGVYAEGRERAKAVFVDDFFPVRLALFELAARVDRRGAPAEGWDLFLVTIDELGEFLADPSAFAPLIDERRRRRDDLQSRVPPFVFEGEIPDPSTWPLRSDAGNPSAGSGSKVSSSTGTTIAGQGVCAGVARGPARVIKDPADPAGLEPGDILVAPITDPAWTPLFLAAAGVVVDVGAQLSHAAIVARELGIPAVVGATDATRIIADGQPIEVDGNTGVVTIG